MAESIARSKSFAFGVRIINLAKYLREQHCFYSLIDQILRSGTSIGSNMEEATGAISRKEFISKTGIALKEARETHYWLRLFKESGILSARMADSFLAECDELVRILTAIVKTTQQSNKS